MSINWLGLRLHKGSQDNAFEELCCQLARSEQQSVGARFVRVGAPDAGVEAYWVDKNGAEKGWQAKYFLASPNSGQWGQIDESVRTALDKHPQLVEYFICMPVDRSDAREANQKSFMDKWNDHVTKWSGWAQTKNMNVKFVFWGNHELVERLSRPANSGRVKFWFGTDFLSPEWFVAHVAVAEANAGPRYTPELNVGVPVAAVFEALGQTPEYYARLVILCRKARHACLDIKVTQNQDLIKNVREYEALTATCDRLIPLLEQVCSPDIMVAPWNEIKTICRTIGAIASTGIRELYEMEAKGPGTIEPIEADLEGDPAKRPQLKPDYGYARHHLSSVSQVTSELEQIAESESSRASNERQLCLIGEAGKGKTHLLCDVARRRANLGYPTLIFLGEHFGISADPWDQIVRGIGFAGNADELLGALESASVASGSRGLILIDALNEGAGKSIWQHYLAGLLEKVRGYEHIGIALSIRSSYIDVILPEQLDDGRLVRVTHQGFEGVEFEAMDQFFQYYDIASPSVPLLMPEFSTPLFLKLICKGLHIAGMKTLPPGFQGVTRIFGFFIESVNSQLSKRLDYDPKSKLVQSAVFDFATALLEAKRDWLSRDVAKDIIERIRPSNVYTNSLFFNLLSEGVLAEDRIWNGRESEDGVRFAYERLSDHMAAKQLLDTHLPTADTSSLFHPDGAIGQFLKDDWACTRYKGLVEALSIQIPERMSTELGRIAPHCASFGPVIESFLQSLPWRDVNSINKHTRTYINEYVVRYHLPELYDAFLTVATNPDHPYNARMLHDHLLKDPLPERDYFWTLAIQNLYGERSAVDRLIKWASSTHSHSFLSDDSVHLGAIALGWFLTAAHRFLRDRATKALVNLLTPRIHLVLELLRDFENVDDPYVRERLYAIAYGCAMRSSDHAGVEALSLYVYRTVFEFGTPAPHLQFRDYARGIVELAYARNPELDVCPLLTIPPYGSPWPRIPTQEEIEFIEKQHEVNGKKADGFSDLHFSVMHDDFARYVIGTNSGHCNWSPTLIGKPMRYKVIKHRLNPKATEFYKSMGLSFKSEATTRELERFDLSQIQRYILWRVLDLGWTREKFGVADHWLRRLYWKREANKVERIGKKYQWIAFSEIQAFMADNFEFTGDNYTDEADIYKGPWQITFGRDIDPSHTLNVPKIDDTPIGKAEWWTPLLYSEWDSAEEDKRWLARTADLPDEKLMIEVRNRNDSSTWLALRSAQHWKSGDTEYRHYSDSGIRELWYEISSFIIRAEDTKSVMRWANNRSFGSLQMPRPGEYQNVYLGEHYWAEASYDYLVRYETDDGWIQLPESKPPIFAHQPGQVFGQESSGYDCSSDSGFSFYIPSCWLVKSMRLAWNGRDSSFLDSQRNVVIFDPTVMSGRECLLARKEAFVEFLTQNGLSLLWILRGEKRLLTDGSRWEGHLEISGSYTLDKGKVVGNKWFHLRTRDGLYRFRKDGKVGSVVSSMRMR